MKYWILAMRPKTLPAAVAPVILGCALAAYAGVFQVWPAILCMLFALFAQILANYSNDYYDGIKGTDNKDRRGPTRMVGAGIISPRAMFRGTWIVCALAFLIGLNLIPYGGWVLMFVGVGALATAILYTAGPYPLGYHGWGDVFVFIFFGLVAVTLTFFIQTGFVNMDSLMLGAACGMMCINMFIASSYRDIDSDSKVGKKTLVVRFGRNFGRAQFAISYVIALLIPLYLVVVRNFPMAILLCGITLPLAINGFRQLLKEDCYINYDRLLENTGKSLLLYSAGVTVGLLI